MVSKLLSGVCVNCFCEQRVNRREYMRGIVPPCRNCGSRLEVPLDACGSCGGVSEDSEDCPECSTGE
jgi:hypothetical protein